MTAALADVEVLAPPRIRTDCTHSYYLYPMLYKSDVLGISRDVFLEALQAEGVHAARYVTPINLLPIFQKHQKPSDPGFDRIFPGYDGECSYGRGQCPIVERVEEEEIIVTNLCRPPNTEREVSELVAAVAKIVANADELRAQAEH